MAKAHYANAVKTTSLSKKKVQKWVFVILALSPSYLGYLLFTLYPNILSAYYSLLEWNGITAAKFVGLDNYIYLFKDHYVWRDLGHNLLLMITVPILTIIPSILLAYLLNVKGYRESALYKVIYFLPNVLAIIVIALLWSFIYDGSNGLLNAILKLFGIDNNEFYWLGDKRTAIWALLPPLIWGGVGFYVIIFMNAMKSIPSSLYESAILDGASHMTRLWKITIPLINPIVRISTLFLVLGVFKGFEIMLIMTNGGPAGSTEVIGLYMFNMAFGKDSHSYGYASAIGMFLFVILIILKLLIDRLSPKDQIEF
ncbi:carbohydrate ABC transporter permease [Paenibacillus eucommiae]|uniref:N-acetylglucosamine transport system permease protein n=1 Tax=Paenibacillus eucommiae TaxID=1355755 RepID=A0ABS4IUG1_9BACL|nr:sugar ABC transporter permease [Paenibacillus eucommiae]MBP1990715.1 N-acetylglucosamine transport system permease protein [Paenibacillus eucommiae]